MSVTGTSSVSAALPAAMPAATPAVDMQQLTATLQSLVQTLTQLISTLQTTLAAQQAQAGAMGGGPAAAAGCGCGGGDAVLGASTLGTKNSATQSPNDAPPADANVSPKVRKAAKNAKSGGAKGAPTDVAPGQTVDDVTNYPRKNPRSVAEAIAWAKNQVDNPLKSWDNLCLSFVAHAYGWSGSGKPMASTQWSDTPSSMRHEGDRNPPPGALVFWKTSHEAGHVALYLGNGMIASNDIHAQGKISIVPMDEIDQKWGAKYLGWTPPYFPSGG